MLCTQKASPLDQVLFYVLRNHANRSVHAVVSWNLQRNEQISEEDSEDDSVIKKIKQEEVLVECYRSVIGWATLDRVIKKGLSPELTFEQIPA